MLVLTLGSLFSRAQTGVYTIDETSSDVQFKVTHLGAFKVDGDFKSYQGDFQFKDGVLQSLKAIFDVASINTDNEERDDILLTEPYFDISVFPSIVFKADTIDTVNDELVLSGSLSIKGQERPLSFPILFEYDSQEERIILKGETQIKRKDFNLVFGSMNGLIGNKVNITVEIVAVKS
ncbi:MAG: YceI family protein [Flavobacteriaceae bacterium]|nr:YceI family protein [Flavobacteriaceae bacterium]